MTQDCKRRSVPLTGLRRHYQRLEKMSTQKRLEECDRLAAEVKPLVDEFLEALNEMNCYDNREEPFFPENGRVEAPDKRGTVDITRFLKEAGSVVVAGLPEYSFEYVEREVNPVRTTRGEFVDGTRSAAGGIDYVAVFHAEPPTPILGEIKLGSDKDAYYAFVQLLTYLSELSSKAQLARANRFLFRDRLVYPVRFDLHILLWDYNDRGQREPVINSTCRLAAAFKDRLTATVGASRTLRRVLCLKNRPGTFAGALDLVWSA